jgi:fido (protein-threonine AMPylation protein)
MMTLRQLASSPADVPSAIAWALADLGEARGRQELFTRQSPQRLKVLREHALVESAVSSNRIHPFRDGNGHVSRLLWLLQSYHLGYDIGRYVSLERLVEEHKDGYWNAGAL